MEVAKKIAVEFFKNNRPQLSVRNLKMVYDGETPASRANGEDPALHVFDNPQGKGFVIVSGDDQAQPIWGYSYENEFPTENLPPQVEGFTLDLRNLYNFSTMPINPTYQIALVSKDNEIKEILDEFEVDTIGPFQGYTSIAAEVEITEPIEMGDRIRLYFKTETDDEWILVTGGEDSVWELLLTDESTLAQQTSVEFDRFTQILKIRTKSNVTVKWTNEDGQDFTDSCNLSGNQITINTEDLPASTYILKLTRGDENLSVRIKLGESQE